MSAKPTVFIPYQDKGRITQEFVNLRVPADTCKWLYEIAKLSSRGHEARCLCPACRARRELDVEP